MNSVASNSIVNLFKQNSKPRTKLFIQSIPPGFTEDEFKELIKNYISEIDYFLFKPGKIIRDPYGHLIGMDNPNYGFATINFVDPRKCPKFHREFNQMLLTDCYNIKAKLIIEFALMQEIPSIPSASLAPPSSISFRELPVYNEFLKTFPFAAKLEEERQASLSSSIDLDDNSDEGTASIEDTSILANELDTKLSVLPSPTIPQLSFSSLLAATNDSTEAVTPLTEFLKNTMAIHDRLPPPNRLAEKQINDKRREEKKKKEQKEKRERKRAKKEKEAAKSKNKKSEKSKAKEFEKTSKGKESEKKSFVTGSNTQVQPSQVQQPAAPVIKGVPKILTRNPPVTAAQPTQAVQAELPKSPTTVVSQKFEPVNAPVTPKVTVPVTPKAALPVTPKVDVPVTSPVPKPSQPQPQVRAQSRSKPQPQVQVQSQSQSQSQPQLPSQSKPQSQAQPQPPKILSKSKDQPLVPTSTETATQHKPREPYVRPEDRSTEIIASKPANKIETTKSTVEPASQRKQREPYIRPEDRVPTQINTSETLKLEQIFERLKAVEAAFEAIVSTAEAAESLKLKNSNEKNDVAKPDESKPTKSVPMPKPLDAKTVNSAKETKPIESKSVETKPANPVNPKTTKGKEPKPSTNKTKSQPQSPTEPQAKSKAPKQTQAQLQPSEPVQAQEPKPVKKVFTSASKKREMEANQNIK